MEEALDILWTYARREPLDSNGETVVPTVNNSIAAIRIIMRLEGWGSEKRKERSEKRTAPTQTMPECLPTCKGKVSKSEISEPFTQPDIDDDEDNDNEGELPFSPTALISCPHTNLLSFTQRTLPSFTPAPFHLAYYEVLTRFAMGEIKKLMITMPPQHGKSEGATRRLPAFVFVHR